MNEHESLIIVSMPLFQSSLTYLTDLSLQIAQEPFIYNFSGVDPDHKAPRLSDDVKERIWRSYTDNPESVTVARLAKEYRIRKQRVHAIVWLKDIEKQEELAQGSPLDNDIEEGFAQIHGSVVPSICSSLLFCSSSLIFPLILLQS